MRGVKQVHDVAVRNHHAPPPPSKRPTAPTRCAVVTRHLRVSCTRVRTGKQSFSFKSRNIRNLRPQPCCPVQSRHVQREFQPESVDVGEVARHLRHGDAFLLQRRHHGVVVHARGLRRRQLPPRLRLRVRQLQRGVGSARGKERRV